MGVSLGTNGRGNGNGGGGGGCPEEDAAPEAAAGTSNTTIEALADGPPGSSSSESPTKLPWVLTRELKNTMEITFSELSQNHPPH